MNRSPGPALGELFDLLRLEGFAVGVDDYMRVGKLLALEVAWSEDQLRSAIRSVIAKDAREKAAFDAVWIRLFASKQPVVSREERALAVPARPSQRPVVRRLLMGLLAGLGVGVVVVTIVWWPWPSRPDPRVAVGSGGPMQQIDASVMDAPVDDVIGSTDTGIAGPTGRAPQDKQLREPAPSGEHDTSDAGAAPGLSKPAVPMDALTRDAPVGGRDASSADAGPPGSSEEPPQDDRSREPAVWRKPVAFGMLFVGGVMLAGGIAIGAMRARRRKRFVPGPWRYSLRVPAPTRPVLDQDDIVDGAAHLSWQAEQETCGDIDANQSVHATASTGGVPVLVYRRPQANATYLVLEDTEGGSERWRFLYDELLSGLAREGVDITRYTFTGDPTWCTNSDGGVPCELRDLVGHCDALIVIGDGNAALDPIEGTPARWLEILRHVPRRLWLNPVPEARWSRGAHVIARDTPMEHGIATCLAALQTMSTDRNTADTPSFPGVIERVPDSSIGFSALLDHLEPAGMRALAAVAMAGAPSIIALRWLVEYFRLALDEATWLRVTALPWFRFDTWPEGLQARLVSWLQATDVVFADNVAAATTALLVEDEPPLGSAAHLRWELDIAAVRARAGDRTSVRAAIQKVSATALHKEIAQRLSKTSSDGAGQSIRVLVTLSSMLCMVVGALLFITTPDLPLPLNSDESGTQKAFTKAEALDINLDIRPGDAVNGYAAIDRADLEPSTIGGFRLRLYISAISLDGKILDLTQPGSIKMFANDNEVRVPYALGNFAASQTNLAMVFVLQTTIDYAGVVRSITEGADAGLFDGLSARTAQAAIVTYGETIDSEKLGSLKTARSKLSSVSIRYAELEPALLDAVDRALQLLKAAKTEPPGRPLRKMIVVVSDGRDRSYDGGHVIGLGNRAAAAGVRIHTFAHAPSDIRRPLLLLGELSKRSFGTFRWIDKGATTTASWQQRFEQLRDEINKQYVLTYFVDKDLAGKKLKLTTRGHTVLTSLNEIKVPAAGCNGATCAPGDYCAESCTHIRQSTTRSVLDWIVIIIGSVLGAALVLGAIGFVIRKR